MQTVLVSVLFLTATAANVWDKQKALRYLETRQQAWADWKPAQRNGGPCVSCHTGLSYMMVRQALGNAQPGVAERELVRGITTRILANPPEAAMTDAGAEAVLNLFTPSLQRQNVAEPLNPADQAALRNLWSNQLRDGKAKGAWTWFDNGLDPMDTEYSNFYGAMLAEHALSTYPSVNPEGRALLQEFMKRNLPKQPLHNKLAWIAFRTDKQRDQATVTAILDKLWAKQSNDGGWTTAALGPWGPHPDAPADPGSNAYATAWAAFTARQSGVGCSVPQMKKALDWLAKRQDPRTGSWQSPSMNKQYPPDSMPAKFMSDAATGFAAAALISCEGQRDRPISTASIHAYRNVE